MKKNPDFEQNFWSKAAEGLYIIGLHSIPIMKWFCYADRS